MSERQAPYWTNVTVRLGDLKPWGHNPRQSSQAQARRLLASWERFGQVEAIAVGPGLEVLDGHQRLSALLTVHGPDYQVDARQASRPLTEAERRELVIALHAGAVGSWDWDVLSAWDGADLRDWGMDDDLLKTWNSDALNLKEMLRAGATPAEAPEPEIDRAEELREKWGVEPGQLWRIPSKSGPGEHRLICGDCTDPAVVERVMDIMPGMMVTDPPYGVEYDPEWRNDAAKKGLIAFAASREGKVENDDISDWSEAWKLFPGDVIYCWHANLRASTVEISFRSTGFEPRSHIVWAKSNFAISRGHYHWQHELCIYGVRKGKPANWIGDRSQTTLWEIAWDKNVEGGHGTQKPVECMARPIRNHDIEVVYDPFCGSGTTLVACEQLARHWRAIEVSPAYVAVALERLAQMGLEPELVEPLDDPTLTGTDGR